MTSFSEHAQLVTRHVILKSDQSASAHSQSIKGVGPPTPSSVLSCCGSVYTGITHFLRVNLQLVHRDHFFYHFFKSKRLNRKEKMSSNVRQNYADFCEEGVNKQINLEMYAMYTYLSLVSQKS